MARRERVVSCRVALHSSARTSALRKTKKKLERKMMRERERERAPADNLLHRLHRHRHRRGVIGSAIGTTTIAVRVYHSSGRTVLPRSTRDRRVISSMINRNRTKDCIRGFLRSILCEKCVFREKSDQRRCKEELLYKCDKCRGARGKPFLDF